MPEPSTAVAVTVLLDLSGTRGPGGETQRAAVAQWTDAQRGTPRIAPRIVDLGGSDAKLFVELKRAADAGDSAAVVVGVPAVVDDALSGAIALLRRPVLFTLPISEPTGDGARWMFGLAPSPEALARALVSALPSVTSPAVVATSGSPASGREAVALAATFRSDGRPMPFVLGVSPAQRDAFTQRLRPLAAGGTSLFFAGPVSGFLEPQRLLPEPGPAAIFLSYLTEPADAARLGDLAATTRWPALRRTIDLPGGAHAASIGDALAIIAASADPAGDPERSRSRIEGGTFAGIATTYHFSAARHVGVDAGEIALVSWDGGRVVPARPVASPR